MKSPDFNSNYGLSDLVDQTFYCDNGDNTWTRIQVNTTNRSLVIDKVDTVLGVVAWITDTPRITLNLGDLTSYAGANKDAKMRSFLFKDANDSCKTKRICLLCTEPEEIPS